MSDGKHKGPDNTSPYPVSRLAPKFDLLNVEKEIEEASRMLSAVARGKLELIARQMRLLQQEALEIIQKAEDDYSLHRAECRFRRVPGKTYHLYRRQNGITYFSMVSPNEWGASQPHEYVGSFQLEDNMSWTKSEQIVVREVD